jgi:hypothetical protein
MVLRKKNFDIKIESAGPWSEKKREEFIELMAKAAFVRFWRVPENREKIRAELTEKDSEKHD